MTLAADYDRLRRGVAGRVVPRDVLRLAGPDAASYLQGQCTQDVEALSVGAAADALLLSPQGKFEAAVRVHRVAPDAFVLDTEAGAGVATRARLERFKLRVKADIEELDWACVSLRGPEAAAAVTAVTAGAAGVLVAPFAWGGAVGVDLLGPGLALPADVDGSGAGAWEALRVEAGVPRSGAELDDRTIPAEVAGLLEHCVSFTKGCYTGQELVARLDARGNKVARHLRGLVVDTGLPPADDDGGGDAAAPAVPVPPGSTLSSEDGDKAVGTVTSSAWSPVLGAVALAYVHRDVMPGTTLELRGAEGVVVTAEVRALPLVS